MKFKKLGFETQEGLSLSNYEDGWSMEYGSGGSYSVDITLQGKTVANVIEEGNGGPVIVNYKPNINKKEIDNAILTFLKRKVEDYGADSKCDIFKNTVVATDTEYSAAVAELLSEHQVTKFCNKQFKAGYQLVIILSSGYQDKLIASKIDDEKQLLQYIKTQKDLIHAKVKGFRRPNMPATI